MPFASGSFRTLNLSQIAVRSSPAQAPGDKPAELPVEQEAGSKEASIAMAG
jgi:hypothetical protein